MQDVGMLLKQLANIAVVVRKSGKGSRLQRADQQFKPEEHKDLQAHLTTMMLLNNIEQRSDLHSVNGTFDPSNLGEIQERIIQCNLKRRNRFLYAQRHSDSLSGRISQEDDARRPQKANPGVMAKPAPDGSESQSQAAVPSTEIEQVQEPTNPTIVTGTRATAISDSLDIPRVTSPSSASASTLLSSTTISLKYPQPPKIVSGMCSFTCPCCCQTLPMEYLEERKWK